MGFYLWKTIAPRDRGGAAAGSLQYYRRAVEINPAKADAQYNLARLLAKRDMVTEAIAGYRRALEIRPNDADAHSNLGMLSAAKAISVLLKGHGRAAVQLRPSNLSG